MKDIGDGLFANLIKTQEQATELLNRLITTARAESVYGEPIERDGVTVITASEVMVALGFGMGSGVGAESPARKDEQESAAAAMGGSDFGGGGGGGGGGYAGARPVAVISIVDDRVTVEPVVDATKLGLAFFTFAASFIVVVGRLLRAAQKSD